MNESWQALKATVARLRAPDGCPWDRVQTHRSLAEFLVEECAELLEAIDTENEALLREELGDVLLQVVMHAQIAAEAGRFTVEDVCAEVNDKLIRRHPHVFGERALQLESAQAVIQVWEQLKAAEKAAKGTPANASRFKEKPPTLPATLRAQSIYKQARKQGLPLAGLVDEAAIASRAEGLTEHDAGRALFEAVAACQRAGLDPESALRRYASFVQSSLDHV